MSWNPSLHTAVLATTLLVCGPSTAAVLVIDSGPNIKTELFRADNGTATWDPIAFSFVLPDSATSDGLFRMFAGGDLNNILIDVINVSTGTGPLGTLAFPVDPNNLTLCEAPAHTNPSPCPVPENVPGGAFQNPALLAVGDIEGRRNVSFASFGTAGLVVPMAELIGGTTLTVSLLPVNDIFDVYIDRVELAFNTPASIPEPSVLLLLSLGIFGLAAFRRRIP
jgi:hypothetical protein